MEKLDEILSSMQSKYTELTGSNPDDASDIGIRLKVLAGELSKLYENLSETAKQAFVLTSTGEYLEHHARVRGIERKGALKAVGLLRFSVGSAVSSNIIIPKGIICSTVGEPSYRFITTEDATIPAGLTHIDVPSQAQEGGEAQNTAINTVTLMITPAANIRSVTNPVPFSGGTDEEDDRSLLKRVEESYKIISNGTNSAYYYQETMRENEITSANVLPRERGVGTVDIVVTSNGVSPSDEAIERISARLSKQREINVDVSVYAAVAKPISISLSLSPLEEYDFSLLSENVEATIRAYINSLKVGEPLILARLGNAIFSTEGVFNYAFTSPLSDVLTPAKEIITCQEIAISRMEV